MQLLIVQSDSFDAHHNQATEATLTQLAGMPEYKNTMILYLWANDNAVFIGKNQNAFLECNLDALKNDGGVLARRITGGGAVYHDKGNLNYSFIAPINLYDQNKQFNVVLSAVKALGFDAELSGRNDILIQGKKFSGNAFFKGDKSGLHHGTLLINSNYQRIAKYLSVSRLKLASKGVKSVESRIVNLSEIHKDINKEKIAKALINAAITEYNAIPACFDSDIMVHTPPLGAKAACGGSRACPLVDTCHLSLTDKEIYNKWLMFLTDEKRLYGDNIFYDARVEHRFDWGMGDVRLKLNKNIITNAVIYSDALDTDLVQKKQEALIGQDIYNVTDDTLKEIIQKI